MGGERASAGDTEVEFPQISGWPRWSHRGGVSDPGRADGGPRRRRNRQAVREWLKALDSVVGAEQRVSLCFFEHRFAARRQSDGTDATVFDGYQSIHDRILPNRKMRATMPAFPRLRIAPRPIR